MTVRRNEVNAVVLGDGQPRSRTNRDHTRACGGRSPHGVRDRGDHSERGDRRNSRRSVTGRSHSRRSGSGLGPAADGRDEDLGDRVVTRSQWVPRGGGGGSGDDSGTVGRSRTRGNTVGASGCISTGGGYGTATRVDALAGATQGGSPHDQQGRRQEHGDFETRWQVYLQGEEFVTFHAVVESLLTLPPVGQLSERRADFELLLHLLHRLGQALEVEHVSKHYRSHYSPDVQLCGYLYSTLLTAFTLLPSYVLNGQEFYVSDTVLDQCKSLQFVFQETCKELKRQFENLQPYSLEHIRQDVKRSLVYFDRSWCRFEMPALEEIEAIHKQACRPLIEAIEVEKALGEWDRRTSTAARGCPAGAHRVRAEVQRTRLMEKICELNRLANIDGKGRSDMDMACVVEAERVVARPLCSSLRGLEQGFQPGQRANGCASPVLVLIARSLLRSLNRLRRILHRYARCLYQLNSHLANNPDLVRGLERFESAWETANRYLVQPGPRRLALLAFDIVSGLSEPGFEAALTSLDPGFLVASLPRAFILHEMQRFLASKTSASVQPNVITLAPSAVKHSAKVEAAGGTMLPRPLEGARQRPPAEGARQRPTAQLVSAYQFSPMSRTFLPHEMMSEYDGAATALGRLSEARVARVRSMLLSTSSALTSPVGSKTTTPLVGSVQHLPKQQAPPSTAERPPPTPCPPRMAVPNSSHGRPASSAPVSVSASAPVPVPPRRPTPSVVAVAAAPTAAAAGGASVEATQEESDDEEEIPTIDLSGLRGAEATEGAELAAAAAAAAASAALQQQQPQQQQPRQLHADAANVTGADVGTNCTGVVNGVRGRSKDGNTIEGGADGGGDRGGGAEIGGGSSGICTARGSTGSSDGQSQEADVCQVVATVSTLALHLQRARPHEWNELIQVVLQGFMLAKSSAKNDGAGADGSARHSTQSKRQHQQPPQHHHRQHHHQVAAEVW